MVTKNNSRRYFLKNASLAGIASACLPALTSFNKGSDNTESEKKDHLTFLFQGDSITDGNRGRNSDPNHIMGHGYAFSIASRVGFTFPENELTFYNRGISGNKVADLAASWQKDTLDLKPDVLSILVGVNDVDAAINHGQPGSVEKFGEVYRSLLNQVQAPLPACTIVLCEPFILPVARVKDNWAEWNKQMQKTQNVVSRLAKEYNAVYIPLQDAFNKASQHPSAGYWIWDGIHPTVPGHEIITRQWLKGLSKRLHFLHKLI